MATFCSIGLTFDPSTMSCDVAIGTNGQPVMDFTAATPLLVSIGCDRRAQPDDVLPYNAGAGALPLPFNPRRGWVGDALDTNGQLIGSRLWLLHREKQTESTRQRAISYATEATAWIDDDYDVPVSVDAAWIARNTLGLTIQAGTVTLPTVPVSLT